MKIYICGTSSSGKTSIMNQFPKSYTKLSIDILNEELYSKAYSKLKNQYYKKKDFIKNELGKLTAKEFKKYKNVILEGVSIKLLDYLPKNTKSVLVYCSLSNLVLNIIKRKKIDPREKFVFNQFARYYVKTDNVKEKLDTVNLDSFIKNLKKIKFEFISEEDLFNFAKSIFKKLGINDNKDHYIKPRDDIYDLVIKNNTTQKELKNRIINHLKKL